MNARCKRYKTQLDDRRRIYYEDDEEKIKAFNKLCVSWFEEEQHYKINKNNKNYKTIYEKNKEEYERKIKKKNKKILKIVNEFS